MSVRAGLVLALGSGGLAACAATAPELKRCATLRHAAPRCATLRHAAPRCATPRSIQAQALDRGYGAVDEARTEWRTHHRGEKLRSLPDRLKADLPTLHSTPKSGRVAETQKIGGTAVAGGYGATIENFAQTVKPR